MLVIKIVMENHSVSMDYQQIMLLGPQVTHRGIADYGLVKMRNNCARLSFGEQKLFVIYFVNSLRKLKMLV